MSKEIYGTWTSMSQPPHKEGWYFLRYKRSKNKPPFICMYFKPKKTSYSDSQWYDASNTEHSWGGRLPMEWLRLEANKDG